MTDRLRFDPYEVLGVGRDATPLQLARAHRRLAKRHHPDLNPDAADAEMRRINEAWDVLSSPARRADFDRRNPAAGLPRAAHWSASRQHVDLGRRPTGTTTWESGVDGPGTYRSVRWAAAQPGRGAAAPAAAASGAARRHPAEPDGASGTRSFRDSPWAAIVFALVLVGFMLLAAGLGSQYWAEQQGPRQLIDIHADD